MTLERFISSKLPASPGRLRLVVVESGAHGLGGHAPSDDIEETIVIGQLGGESTAELASRVSRRLADAERLGRRLATAVLLLAQHLDAPSMAARQHLARALLTHAETADSAELLISAEAGAGAEGRERLLTLVENLLGAADSKSVPIRVCFGARETAA